MGNIVGTLCMHGCVEPVVGGYFAEEPFTEKQLTAETLTEILHNENVLPESAQVQEVMPSKE